MPLGILEGIYECDYCGREYPNLVLPSLCSGCGASSYTDISYFRDVRLKYGLSINSTGPLVYFNSTGIKDYPSSEGH